MFWLKSAVWSFVFAGIAAAAVWAAEEKKADPVAKAAATPEEIAQWIKQLDADKFADRQTASEKLYGAGKAVIPAITEAATGESLEVTIRTIDLLQRFKESEVKAVKQSAKEALEKIAKSDNDAAARRAKEVLHPTDNQQPNMGGLNMPIGPMNMKAVKQTMINGASTIEAEEGDRKISITTNPDKSVKIEITEKVDDKDVTKKYVARNAAELKKKHPKVYDTYQEYANNNPMGGMRLNVIGPGGMMGGAGGMPALPPQLGKIRVQGLPGGVVVGAGEEEGDLAESLKIWNESLNTLRGDLDPEKLSPEEKKELKEQIQDLKKQLDDLDKRLKK